jgi:hypothetical protein
MLFENVHVVPAIATQTGAAIAGDWVKLTNYNKCLILLCEQRGADANTTAFRVNKAKTAAGGSVSTGISLANHWYVEGAATTTGDIGATAAATVGVTDVWTKDAAATSHTGVATQNVTSWYAIEVAAEELGDGFNWLQLNITASNAAHRLTAFYVLYEPRYARAGDKQATEIA